MASSVQNVRITALYGRCDVRQEFKTGVNILYGKNGTCKTTFLSTLANIVAGDWERFAWLPSLPSPTSRCRQS